MTRKLVSVRAGQLDLALYKLTTGLSYEYGLDEEWIGSAISDLLNQAYLHTSGVSCSISLHDTIMPLRTFFCFLALLAVDFGFLASLLPFFSLAITFASYEF